MTHRYWVTVRDVSIMLGATPWTAYKMAQAGELTSGYIGSRLMVSRASVIDYAGKVTA